MCDKAGGPYLLLLKFVPDFFFFFFFFTNMIEKLDNVVFSHDYIVIGNLQSFTKYLRLTLVFL